MESEYRWCWCRECFHLKTPSFIFAYEKVPPPQRRRPCKDDLWGVKHQWIRCRPTVPLKVGSWKESQQLQRNHWQNTEKKESTYNSWHQSIMVNEMDSNSADQKRCWRGISILSLHQSAMAMQSLRAWITFKSNFHCEQTLPRQGVKASCQATVATECFTTEDSVCLPTANNRLWPI